MVAKINLKLISNKKALLAIAVIVVVGAFSYAGYAVWSQRQQAKPPISQNQKLLNDVSNGTLAIGNDETRKKLESSLNNANDKEQYQLYLLLANEYQVAKEHKKAAETLRQAESINANDDLLFTIASEYEQAGNRADALAYYKKTKKFLADNPNEAVRNKDKYLDMINTKIKELESSL